MQFADGKLKIFDDNTNKIKELINSYTLVEVDMA